MNFLIYAWTLISETSNTNTRPASLLTANSCHAIMVQTWSLDPVSATGCSSALPGSLWTSCSWSVSGNDRGGRFLLGCRRVLAMGQGLDE